MSLDDNQAVSRLGRFLDHPRVALVLGLLLGGSGFVAQQLNSWFGAWICWSLAILVVLSTAIASDAVQRYVIGWTRFVPFEVHRRVVADLPLVNAAPSGGPSPDVRLAITNRGRAQEFQATAQIVAVRNAPPARIGTYKLAWLENGSSVIQLRQHHTASLLVARYQTGGGSTPWLEGRINLIEALGGRELEWQHVDWLMDPALVSFPEVDIDVHIIGGAGHPPLLLQYTLRPGPYDPQSMARPKNSPLELVERDRAKR